MSGGKDSAIICNYKHEPTRGTGSSLGALNRHEGEREDQMGEVVCVHWVLQVRRCAQLPHLKLE